MFERIDLNFILFEYSFALNSNQSIACEVPVILLIATNIETQSEMIIENKIIIEKIGIAKIIPNIVFVVSFFIF